MTGYHWKEYLTQWSAELLAAEDIRAQLPAEVIASGWMGYLGATEAQIAATEARLGKLLPPSYREFLKVTNGWRNAGAFIDKLWSVEEIDWFTVRNQDWVAAWTDTPDRPVVSDEDYFVYGENQDGVAIRTEYLKTALEISDVGDSAIYLLNPQVVTPEGEWEAWFFANWIPGAARYRSFWEMMQAERRNFLELQVHDAKRYKGANDSQGLRAKLPGLIEELEHKARLFERMHGQAALDVYTRGNIEGLEMVAEKVRQIGSQTDESSDLAAQLRALADETEQEQRRLQTAHTALAHQNLWDLPMGQIGRVTNDFGRAEGFRQAAGIIRWFLDIR